ncbi:MAG: TRAP transporter large permease [Synergistaceae bacterium]|jgi:C4-dicarboxylate transporter DctM subunit|nr:TRAP transporter large permease [Synergistaceae bacterium]
MWLLVLFIALLFGGMRIPFAIAFSSFIALLVSNMPLILIPQRIIAGIDSFALLAVPFFLLAGEVMKSGGLSRRLVRFANALIGHITAGLPMVMVLSATFFAAISGSAPATTASIGSVMIPEMEKKNYPKPFAAALAAASGPIGQMIPPSIPMVVWAVIANVSIVRMFLGGILPGVLMATALMLLSRYLSKKRSYGVASAKAPRSEVIDSFKDGFWALMTPVIILGGIYSGVFTPTEAAAVAVAYGLFVGFFIYGELKLSDLPEILYGSVKSTAIVIFVVAAASLFGWIMASEMVAPKIAQSILNITTNKYLLLLMLNVMLLLIGCFMDNIAAMIILAGVLTSIAGKAGVDPVHFGVIVVINFAIGMVTPPLGYSLFVGASISDQTIETVSRAVWPFIMVEIVVLAILTYCPWIALSIPNLVYQ